MMRESAGASSRVNLPAAWRCVNPIGPRASRKSCTACAQAGTAPDLSTTARGRESGTSYGPRWACQLTLEGPKAR